MKLLRPDVPVGVSVWRDASGGPIVEAAYVWDSDFVWCGLSDRIPPTSIEVLAARNGREQFWVYDDEESDLVGGAAPGFLGALVAAGLSEPSRLMTFCFPSGESETAMSGQPLGLTGREQLGPSPRWDAPTIFPANEATRVAKYRRHQSWYRANVLKVSPGAFGNYPALGSYMDAGAVTSDPTLNFLTADAAGHAEDGAVVVKAEGGALDPVRLRHNMLSSMPMCFNVFGSLRGDPAFLTLFQQVFDEAATRIIDVLCEYAPQPPSDYLADRTAFDAIVFYETEEGLRFLGIETKYTESFSETAYISPRYDEVTATCGWFDDPSTAPGALSGRKSNQLWRNLMLAASLERARTHGRGAVAIVALEEDPGAAAAIKILREHLADQTRLLCAPIETILDAADRIPELAPWSAAFRVRYIA